MNARSQLIHDHESFLRDYRSRFQAVFVKVCRVLAPQLDAPQLLHTASVAFYDRYFLDPSDGAVEAAREPLAALAEKGLDVAPVLSKCFAVMTSEFVAHVVKSGEVVEPVHALTEVMRDALSGFDEAAEHHTHDENAVVRMVGEHLGDAFTLQVTCAGVQINEGAVLEKADPMRGALRLQLPEGHRVSVDRGDRINLNAEFLPRPLMGQVDGLDDGTRILTVSDIIEVEHSARPRGALRVQPPSRIDVEISCVEGRWEGVLADLSVGGISVTTLEEVDRPRGSWVHVRFDLRLPGRAEPAVIDARAEIAAARQAGKEWRYGLRLMPNLHEEKLIGEYINRLQTEVIRRIQPEDHHSIYHGEVRRRPLSPLAATAIGAVVVTVFVGALYWAVQQRKVRHVGIDRIAEMLSIQEECDDLTARYSRTGNPNDLEKFEACIQRLERARERTRWQGE